MSDLKIDFQNVVPESQLLIGWLEKKGNIRQNWKPRYFVLHEGILKYYVKGPNGEIENSGIISENINSPIVLVGQELKREYPLHGAVISLGKSTRITMQIRVDMKKEVINLKANTPEEANEWFDAISNEIDRSNIIALKNHGRAPEIVEWYYQKQADIIHQTQFLHDEAVMDLHYSLNGRMGSKNSTTLYVKMVPDRTGLLIRIIIDGRKLTRIESLNNGRVLLFQDIIGAFLPNSWSSSNGNFVFTLITKEDQLSLEMSSEGVAWLTAVHEVVRFLQVPVPAARLQPSRGGRYNSRLNSVEDDNHPSYDDGDDDINDFFQFTANSGVIFHCSADVQMILENMNHHSSSSIQSISITDLSHRLNTILKLLSDVKCNRDAAMNFGTRLEDMTRVLADKETGIIYNVPTNDRNMFNFNVSAFHNRLRDIETYVTDHVQKGWLAIQLNRPNQSIRLKFEAFDSELCNALNIMIKANGNSLGTFERKEYTMAVDVKQSVEALGGVEAIHYDVAKEKALARLIQSDVADIHSETEEILKTMGLLHTTVKTPFETVKDADPRSTVSNSVFHHTHVFRPSADDGADEVPRCWDYFSCCQIKKSGRNPHKYSKNRLSLGFESDSSSNNSSNLNVLDYEYTDSEGMVVPARSTLYRQSRLSASKSTSRSSHFSNKLFGDKKSLGEPLINPYYTEVL